MTAATVQRPAARRGSRAWSIGIGLLTVIALLAGLAAYVAQSMPAPAAVEAPPDPALARLAELDDHLGTIDTTLAHLIDALHRIETDVGEIRTRLAAPVPVPHPVVLHAHRVARILKPTPVTRPAPPAGGTRLLSVDVWGGRTSIALRMPQGDVRFFQDGETTPLGRLAVGPLASQSVRIERPDGTSFVLHALEER